MTVSDELLIAYVDGELSDAARREVDHAAQEDAAVAAQLAAHKRLRAGLAEAYVPVLDEAVPEALLAAVMATDNHKVSSFTPRRRSLPAWSHWAAMAACLALGLAVGFGARDAALVAPDMTARGALATALDQQLASNQGAASIRIGVTFTDTSGAYCRTFQASDAGVAGLACREGKAWRVPVLSAVSPGGEGAFRTASSMPPAVATAVDLRMGGEALNADSEAKAKADGWSRK